MPLFLFVIVLVFVHMPAALVEQLWDHVQQKCAQNYSARQSVQVSQDRREVLPQTTAHYPRRHTTHGRYHQQGHAQTDLLPEQCYSHLQSHQQQQLLLLLLLLLLRGCSDLLDRGRAKGKKTLIKSIALGERSPGCRPNDNPAAVLWACQQGNRNPKAGDCKTLILCGHHLCRPVHNCLGYEHSSGKASRD
jgi:hypothetical protein